MTRLLPLLFILPACNYYSSDVLTENEIAAHWWAKQHTITSITRVHCWSKFVASDCDVFWAADGAEHQMRLRCQREGSETGAAHFCERQRDE